MLNEILTEIMNNFNRICVAQSTITRKKYGEMIIQLLEEYPDTQKYWLYLPDEFLWCNRFKRIEFEGYPTAKEIPIYDDPSTNLRQVAPNESGLYFFGNTVFDPITEEKFYWVKIGLSINMYKRGKAYETHNPSIYPIAFKTVPEYMLSHEETKYQNFLKKEVLFKHQNNQEWFLVSRETYFAICEKGFDYFSKTY